MGDCRAATAVERPTPAAGCVAHRAKQRGTPEGMGVGRCPWASSRTPKRDQPTRRLRARTGAWSDPGTGTERTQWPSHGSKRVHARPAAAARSAGDGDRHHEGRDKSDHHGGNEQIDPGDPPAGGDQLAPVLAPPLATIRARHREQGQVRLSPRSRAERPMTESSTSAPPPQCLRSPTQASEPELPTAWPRWEQRRRPLHRAGGANASLVPVAALRLRLRLFRHAPILAHRGAGTATAVIGKGEVPPGAQRRTSWGPPRLDC